ncbi:MAG: DUF4230 domain-containing protein [Bacteroidia bacterium]|nr:DUF4230 domain-containing protein [Bacteroidia bacterium]
MLTGLLGVAVGGVGALYLLRKASPPAAPKPSKEAEQHNFVVQQITALGEIELLQYQVRDVMRKEWHYTLPFTSSRLLMILAGEARICMDFSAVKVVFSDWESRTLSLELPPPKVCMVKVDPSRSQVYDADFSVVEWWSGNEAERVREALSAAQESLRVRLSREIPVEAARTQAEALLRRLCESMGWQKVTFTYRPAA